MTMPWGSAEEPTAEIVGEESVAVRVVSTDARPEKSFAPEFGNWRTFVVSPAVGNDMATPGAVRIAQRSLRRHRLHIMVNSTVVNQPFIDGVIIGSRTDIEAALNASNVLLYNPGGYIRQGTSLRWESQQELWACYPSSNTNAVLVSVCDEQYASDPNSGKDKR